MLLTGSEILIKSLIDLGVETIFGYPGGAVLNIYDSLYKNRENINHILTCHEQAAAHAADGYARSTGKVGVCLATSGPGATNLVTGIATAYMDSIPMVAITGNVGTALLGKDSFQEVDIKGITMPITKHNYMVKNVEELEETIKRAFTIAKEGRPGPVLIDIPKDVTAHKAEYKNLPIQTSTNSPVNRDIEAMDRVVEMINSSKKPFIYAGGGIILSDAVDELNEFAKKINSPVATSLMGRGSITKCNPLSTGMIGMHGTKKSNLCATRCDLMIVLGARFSDRVMSNKRDIKNARIIHIDIDPAEINKNINVDEFIIDDLKDILNTLIEKVEVKNNEDWIKEVENFGVGKFTLKEKEGLSPKLLFDKLNNLNEDNFIITTEVGQHQMWTSQYFDFSKPRTFITSGGLGTMGFGMGAAIGSQIANPDKQVINIAGDGSFSMNCNEIATLVKYNLPLIVIVMNNNVLGMVRQWQDLFYEGRYSHTTLDRGIDYVKLADAYGAKGFKVTNEGELDTALDLALKSKGPVIIEYAMDKELKVFPMVAPGAPIDEIIYE